MSKMRMLIVAAISFFYVAAVNAETVPVSALLADHMVHAPDSAARDDEIARMGASWNKMVTFAAADSAVRSQHQAQAETARTDKQPGAAPATSGTTSLASKPGLAELFTFAVEQGAVEKGYNATSATFRTSPYLVMTSFGTEDTAANYEKYWFWRMFEFHVSYPVSTNANSNEAREIVDWGTRLRLYGDRSPRSARFIQLWNEQVRPLAQQHVNVLSGAFNVWQQDKRLDDISKTEMERTKRNVAQYLQSTADTDPAKVQKVQTMIEEGVARSAAAVKAGLPARERSEITRLLASDPGEEARQRLLAIIDEVAKSPLLTLEFVDEKVEQSSDVAHLLLEYQSRVEPLDLIVNARSSFYHDPDQAGADSSVKEYGATIALEWKGRNFLLKPSDEVDMSQITLSGTGAVAHVEGIGGLRGNAQLRLEIPLRKGITLPLALSYATRTDTSTRSEIRGNFGLTFDWTKLIASAWRY